MAPPTDRLFTLARSFLDQIVAGWPGDAEPLPDRQYVSNGLVVWDCCEQLAVQVERTYGIEGDVTGETVITKGVGFAMRAATVAITLLRFQPDLADEGDSVVIPSAQEIEDGAAVLLGDATALLNVIVAAQKAGDLVNCDSLAFEDWNSQGPEAGIGGGILRVRAALL